MLPFSTSGFMPQPQSKRRGLLDALIPGEGFSEDDRKGLMRRGLLEAALTTLATPTGTGSALMGVSRGLLGGLQGMEAGANDLERRRYTQSIRDQQQAAQQREVQLAELRRMAYNPDGSINEQGMAQLRQFDPLAAAEFEKAVTPKDDRPSFIRELDFLRQNPQYMGLAEQLYGMRRTPQYGNINGTPIRFTADGYEPVGPAGGNPPPQPPQPAPLVASVDSILANLEKENGAPFPPDQREQYRAAIERDLAERNGQFDTGPGPDPNAGFGPEFGREAPITASAEIKAAWPTLTPDQRREALTAAAGIDKPDPANLRKEFDAATKDYRVIRDSAAKVESAAQAGTAAGDMSLIFAYMKMLDPASTVREGEYASAQNTTGIPGQIVNLYNKARDGQFLSPQQRQDFLAQARSIAAQKQREFETNYSRYSELATRAGLSPEDVVFDPFAEPSGDGEIGSLVDRWTK